jgi:regulator of protease activity HflC (stomatin/prohibitin superfamily)
MYNYIFNAARNAVYKSARKYEALDMGDNRSAIEQEVRETIAKTLADEKLDGTITITQVLVRNITPADSIVQSANELVKAKNEYKTEEVKVATAKKRNESMQANPTMIPLMKAEAEAQYLRDMPGAIANFKGQTLIIGGGATPVVPVGSK